MILGIEDWVFDIDPEKTSAHSAFALESHCTCGYCENYYRSVEFVCPGLKPLLERFFVEIQGPSRMYPFEPDLCLLGYKVYGTIVRYAAGPIMVDGIPVMPVPLEEGLFLLEVGEISLPWVLEEDMDDVISPANEPEYLEEMYRIMRQRGYFTDLLPS